ncbi:MAG: acetate--CoA ligase family protein [Planctomycetaceae bacterium]
MIQLQIERRLDSTNAWSRHKTLIAGLCDVPAATIFQDQRELLFESLSNLELPPHRSLLHAVRSAGDLSYSPSESWGHTVVQIAADLQFAVGLPRFRGYVQLAEDDTVVIGLECLEFEVAVAALQAAVGMINQLLITGTPDAAAALNSVQTADEHYSFGDATGPIVAAARHRGLPVLRLDDESRVQFGEGIYSRRIRKAAMDTTGFLAEQASTDKAFTKRLWSTLGIPVAQGRVVVDPDDAVRLAEQLGWPVVVKPLDSDYSNGVTLNVRDPASVRTAYKTARQESESVMVERTLPGAVHRFLIVSDRVVSVVRRDPAGVVGDGHRSIRELVECENQSPRRGPDYRWPLHRLQLADEELAYLADQGLTADSIPTQGQRIELRREPYLTSGGESHEVLDQVHPETLTIVRDAVRVVGLDLAGVDLIARDISIPLAEQNGGLLELNAQPAICLHLAPFNDKPQPVGEAIVDSMFPDSATGRIPLIVVVGSPAQGDLQSFAEAGKRASRINAVSASTLTQIQNRKVLPRTDRPFDRLAAMNLHPRTTGSCLAASAESLLANGLGSDHCQMLILADSSGITPDLEAELDGLFLRLLSISETCLVNCDDPVWATRVTPGEPSVVLASTTVDRPVLRRHLETGGRIITREGDDLVLRSGVGELIRCPAPEVPTEGRYEWLIKAASLLDSRIISERMTSAPHVS